MTTFVLVPGAGGRGWYWHLVVPELERRGHMAVAVELPTGDDAAGLAAYADAIVAVASGLTDVVLVAQSMGAFSAPLACSRLDVRLLVLVNPMVPRPGETAGEWWGATEQPAAVGGPVDLLETFFHDVPENVVAEAMSQGEPEQSDRPFADPWPLEEWPAVPVRVLQGRDDRLFPLAFQQRVVGARLPGVSVEELPGGHLLALSQPVELVDRLEALSGR